VIKSNNSVVINLQSLQFTTAHALFAVFTSRYLVMAPNIVDSLALVFLSLLATDCLLAPHAAAPGHRLLAAAGHLCLTIASTG
jgi:succinate-acetate transporter protein